MTVTFYFIINHFNVIIPDFDDSNSTPVWHLYLMLSIDAGTINVVSL